MGDFSRGPIREFIAMIFNRCAAAHECAVRDLQVCREKLSNITFSKLAFINNFLRMLCLYFESVA